MSDKCIQCSIFKHCDNEVVHWNEGAGIREEKCNCICHLNPELLTNADSDKSKEYVNKLKWRVVKAKE